MTEGLDKLTGVSLIPTVPARIADLVRSNEADIGLCSLADLVRGDLAALPVGMIGCDGPTLTVRLFSSVPLNLVTAVYADTDSHTSVVLCRILLKRLYGIDPALVDFDARERVAVGQKGTRDGVGLGNTGSIEMDDAWPQTVLLIGDKVVVDAPRADRYPYQLDLGEAWKRLTGLPFVYAVWACRSDRADDPAVQTSAAVLDRQRRHNRSRLDWIVNKHAAEHRWPTELARQYLGSYLRYNVGPREREAVERFTQEGAAWLGGGRVAWASAAREPASV